MTNKGIDVLYFAHKKDEITEEPMTEVQGGCNSPPMPQYLYQTGYMTYGKRLDYDLKKARIDVEKNQVISNQRLEHEQKKENMKLRNKARLEMLSYEITEDSLGRIFCSQISLDEEKICSKILLNVINYTAVHLVSYNPEEYRVLGIAWEGCGDAVLFEDGPEGISSQTFLRRLKARGVVFRVSKRNESAVADALLSYSRGVAEECEIPFHLGWNRMGDGRWHFAYSDEVTMKEVHKYV